MESDEVKIDIIILAGGSSSRMGESKQLLDVGGEALLRRTTRIALSTRPNHSIVVLGSKKDEHSKVIEDLPVEVIYNPGWQNGMGSSLKAGINHLMQITSNSEVVIILVCDQPLITTGCLDKIKKMFESTKSPIVASTYSGTFGVPALFASAMFPDLLALDDDQGAKKVIQQNLSLARMIPFPEGAIDLDTPQDYANFNL